MKKQEVIVPSESKKKASFKEKKEHEDLQKLIARLEGEKKALSDRMSSGSMSNSELIDASAQLEAINEKLDESTLRWMELDEIVSV